MAKSADAFRTISEVSELLDIPAHVLRFWESRFTQIKPVKRAGGRRYYRPADVDLIAGLKKLLHEDGMSIRDAQKLMRAEGVRHVAALAPVTLGSDEAEAVQPAAEVKAAPTETIRTETIPAAWPEAPAPEAASGAVRFPQDPEDAAPAPLEPAAISAPAQDTPWPEAPSPEAPAKGDTFPQDPDDSPAQKRPAPTADWTQPSLFEEAPMAENVEPPAASAKLVSLRLEPRAPRPARSLARSAPATPDLLDTIPPGPTTRLRARRAADFTPEELAQLRGLQTRMSALHERLAPARR